MPADPTFSRRLLLSRGVGAAFMLPATVQAAAVQAIARPAPRRAGRHISMAPLIVLDPGHGGKDPGAIGVSGTFEKHIAFAVAGELTRVLRATGRYRIALTRENDVFIPLEDRVAMAQDQGAALLVSLHADAVADHAVQGASVYTLAAQASDSQSAGLATHENAADRRHSAASAPVSADVADILASLARHETRAAAAHLQQHLVTALGHRTRLLDNPARHAAFAVLKATDTPSALVEMGFMSNPRDEAALREPSHRAIIASAIGRAVEAYFSPQDHAMLVG